jgi:hypothetical protein
MNTIISISKLYSPPRFNFANMSPQVLPSGARKLTDIQPPEREQDVSNANVDRAQSVGITGLAGTISTEDYAYTTGAEAQLVMKSIQIEQATNRRERRPRNELTWAWLTAEKADPNECVVIDFRDFIVFNLNPYPGMKG